MNLSEALSYSRYAQRMTVAHEAYQAVWQTAADAPLDRKIVVEQPLAEALAKKDADDLARVMRHIRQRVMLHTMARDLLGLADLDEVCGTMGHLADSVNTDLVRLMADAADIPLISHKFCAKNV